LRDAIWSGESDNPQIAGKLQKFQICYNFKISEQEYNKEYNRMSARTADEWSFMLTEMFKKQEFEMEREKQRAKVK
jgi:hypothetical protein